MAFISRFFKRKDPKIPDSRYTVRYTKVDPPNREAERAEKMRRYMDSDEVS